MNGYLYAVVLTFPKDISGELENLRKKYNKSTYEIVPHITLKMPFSLSTDLPRIVEALNGVSLKTKQFDIEMNGLGYFENSINGAVYVALKDAVEATNLHKQIVFAIKNYIKNIEEPKFEFDNYIPHATIGESIPRKDIQQSKLELSNYNPKYKIRIDSFSLFSSKDSHKWALVKKFNLQK